MTNKQPLIIVDGEIPSLERINKYLDKSKEIISTDGATNTLKEINLTPDRIIGDLDSIDPTLLEEFANQIIHQPSQYKTDLEKSLDYLLEKNYSEVLLTGITGKRFDHAMTNLSLLAKYSDQIKISFFDEYGDWTILNSKSQQAMEFTVKEGTIISLISLPTAKGITTEGLFYPLNNDDLEFGANQVEAISNFAKENIKISFQEGCLAVYRDGTY